MSATDGDLPAQILSYSLIGAPTGSTIGETSGEFSWTPTSNQAGSHEFIVRVTDDGPGSLYAEETITISVSGAPVPAPTISGFTPGNGPPGTQVTITGANFDNTSSIAFNGANALFYTVNSSNQILVTVPSNATTGKISVTTPGGTAVSSGSFRLSYPKPSISSFNPTSGPVGTIVTITGNGFLGATSVKFNGIESSSFTVAEASTLYATVPVGASTGKISVTTPGGSASSKGNFNVINANTPPPAPTISRFSPTSGPVGTLVTIYGTNFIDVSSVAFNGISNINFTVIGTTQIEVQVPPGATSGKISVITPGGTATSKGNFRVTAAISANMEIFEEEMTGKVYPNPYVSHFTFKMNNPLKETFHIRLIDLFGRVLYEAVLQNSNEEVELGHSLPAGLYHLYLSNDKRVEVFKVVKEGK